MRKFALAAIAALSASGLALAYAADAPDPAAAPAGDYKTDPGHRYITFSYLHFGLSHPELRWRSWEADLVWNPAKIEKSSVTATIDVNSIDTGVDKLDEHLKSADFFDAAQYPTITFKSTKIEKTGPDSGKMTGDLTIKNVTKPVTLDVTFNNGGPDPFGKGYKIGFDAKGTLKRSEFDVGAYVPKVGDDIDFVISAEFKSMAPDAK